MDYIPEESGVPVFKNDDIQGSTEHILRLSHDYQYYKKIHEAQTELSKAYAWEIITKQTLDFIYS